MRTNHFFSETIWAAGRAKKALAFGVAAMAFALLLLVGLQAATTRPAHAATTFTVNKTSDNNDLDFPGGTFDGSSDGKCDTSAQTGRQCTLRAAIQEANETSEADTINFAIGGKATVKTINVGSTGNGALPIITDTVTINGYTQRGSRVNTRATGNDAVLKIQLNGANAGTDANGLQISASNSTIKGLVINRFGPNSVDSNAVVIGSGDEFNKVEGNFIGTNAKATQALGNGLAGVFILGKNNTVGGTLPAARNVISGNNSHGVLIRGTLGSGTDNKVEGNFIGTTANGGGDLGNNERGVAIQQNANSNTIGGTASSARNVISGNGVSGVAISGSALNKVEGNFIGTTANGSGALGNGQGVHISAGSDNTIGDSDPSDGLTNTANTIAFNTGDGVVVDQTTSTGNRILSNRIFQNSAVGIDLVDLPGSGGVTTNDTDDTDTGANNRQNFPVITSATRNSTTGITTITGTLNSNPSQTYTIRCFSTETGGDPSNHGEGKTLLDTTTTTTNADGDSPSFTCTSNVPAVGDRVSMTATNTSGTATGTAIGDTSEFSLNKTVASG